MTSDDDASSPARARALFNTTLWAQPFWGRPRKVLHPARARDAAPAHHRSPWSSSPAPLVLLLPCLARFCAPMLALPLWQPSASRFLLRMRPIVVVRHVRPHMCTIRNRSSLRATCIPTLPLVSSARAFPTLPVTLTLTLTFDPYPIIGSPTPRPRVVELEARMHTTYVA